MIIKNNKNEQSKHPIAVVGIGCRFPGASNSPREFWEILKNGLDCIIDVPSDRWHADVFYEPDPTKSGCIKSKQGGFIKDINKFDAEFFGLYGEEAAQMDPQQRIALEVAYEALEDAGEPLKCISGKKISVFISGFLYDYAGIQMASSQRHTISPYAAMGISVCSLANRISYFFNLKGPSISIDTACSGSLVALHLACNSIWHGEAISALAGGVNVLLRPEASIVMSKAGFLSPDSRCKAFDQSANGYVRGEGCGIVYLKPLAQAILDQDDIYSIILGSCVNQDGYTSAGFTVPDRNAQITMLKTAYDNAAVNPADVVYIEAHGPGTPIGDPIEASALGEIIGQARKTQDKCLIGSVKTNLGHLEGASGIAGFIKAALVLKNRSVPPNLHFKNPNPSIDFSSLGLKVPTENIALANSGEHLPLAAVNSFGAGGTNAHVIIQAVAQKFRKIDYLLPNKELIFVISAKSLAALKKLVANYIAYLQTTTVSLTSLSLAQFSRQTRYTHQLYIKATTLAELIKSCSDFIKDLNRDNSLYVCQEILANPKLAFTYSGQGGQWPEMGVALMQSSTIFCSAMEEFDQAFIAVSGWSIIAEINKPSQESLINNTEIVQPAIVAVQLALTKLLQNYGLQPDGIIGHSIGEIPAAFAAGAITLQQAAAIIYHRAKIQNKASGKGKMLAIGLAATEAEKLIENYKEQIDIATINGPTMITLSGDAQPLKFIAAQLSAQGIFNKFVNVTIPYHSHHMDPLAEELIEQLGQYKTAKTQIPLYSTVTANIITADRLNGHYWFLNVRKPVLFTETIKSMLDDGFNTFIEIGPHPVLVSGIKDLVKQAEKQACVAATMDRREPSNNDVFFKAIFFWLAAGNVIPGAKRKSLPLKLPNYPWQHLRYWHEGNEEQKLRTTSQLYPFFKARTQFVSNETVQLWDVGLGTNTCPYLTDHKVDGALVYPAAAHIMMVLAAAQDFYRHNDIFLSDLFFDKPLIVPEHRNLDIKLEINGNEGKYNICSIPAEASSDDSWTKHSSGKINSLRDNFNSRAPTLNELKQRFSNHHPLNITDFYTTISNAGLHYGKTFQCIKELWCNDHEALARLELHADLHEEAKRYLIHPSLYDAHLQLIFAVQQRVGDPNLVYLPNKIQKLKIYQQAPKTVWAYMKCLKHDSTWLHSDHWLYDTENNLVAELHKIAAKCVPNTYSQVDLAHADCAEYSWQQEELGKIGIWNPIIKGGLHNCIILAEQDSSFAKILAKQLIQERPEINVQTVNITNAITLTFEQFALDRRSHVIYIPRIHDNIEQNITNVRSQFLQFMQKIITLQAVPNIFLLLQTVSNVTGTEINTNLGHAILFGMVRVFANEYPNISIRIIDIDTLTEQDTSCTAICKELLYQRQDVHVSEIAFRNNTRYVRQLHFTEEVTAKYIKNLPASSSWYAAYPLTNKTLGEIEFRRTISRELHPDELQIAVRASGLNYKDLMNSMGLLSSRAIEGGLAAAALGLDVAGTVMAVGTMVCDFQVGDEVIARVTNGFSGICIATADCVTHKPANYLFTEAAAIPIVYLTAYYSLCELARLTADETVLIHSAAGGVGIAAIHLAKVVGAKIIATVGNRKKATYLKDNLDLKYVFDSRSNSFYDEVMVATNGQGVDVVLNSLTGNLITQGLKCLKPYGRFVELGKTDLYNGSLLSMGLLAENISYHVVDVDRLAAQKPILHKKLLQKVVAIINQYKLPAHPLTTYPIAELGKALKQMARSSYVGKIVLVHEGHVATTPSKEFMFASTGAFIITGGASGLGLCLAEWLAGKGATKLILVSRSGCKNSVDQQRIDNLAAGGTQIIIQKLDIAKKEAVKKFIAKIYDEFTVIAGIIHAAALMDDALIPNMNEQRFDYVFKPKGLGAWNLHLACEELGIKPNIFLMISSMSSVLGLKGQVNYAAANYFEDALAEYRQALGLKAASINLGVLGEYAGMSKIANDSTGILQLLETHGFKKMLQTSVLAKIEACLIEEPVHRFAVTMNWQDFGLVYPNLVRDSRFVHIFQEDQLNLISKLPSQGHNLQKELVLLTTQDEQLATISKKLANAIADLTGMSPDKISTTESINRLSLDSIMLSQIAVWILRNAEINYPVIKLLQGLSLEKISAELLPQILKENKVSTSQIQQQNDDSQVLFSIGCKVLTPWLIRGKSSGDEAKRVICFHSMGASASLFTYFLLNPPKNTDLLAIQYPGRENRAHEPFLQTVDEIVHHLLIELIPYLDRPYIFWGHSFGGIVAFETIRKLRELGLPEPFHFNLTATIAPHLIKLWQNREVILRMFVKENDSQYLVSLSKYIEDPEFIKRILPIMRHDMPILQTYQYKKLPKFNMPISCWTALQDDVVYPDEVVLWKEHTNAIFTINEVNGDHWFLNSNKTRIISELEKIIVGYKRC